MRLFCWDPQCAGAEEAQLAEPDDSCVVCGRAFEDERGHVLAAGPQLGDGRFDDMIEEMQRRGAEVVVVDVTVDPLPNGEAFMAATTPDGDVVGTDVISADQLSAVDHAFGFEGERVFVHDDEESPPPLPGLD